MYNEPSIDSIIDHHVVLNMPYVNGFDQPMVPPSITLTYPTAPLPSPKMEFALSRK
jgi:hypothetical protein